MKNYLKLGLMIIACFTAVWGAATIAEKNMTPRETVLEQRVTELEGICRKQQEQIDDIMHTQKDTRFGKRR